MTHELGWPGALLAAGVTCVLAMSVAAVASRILGRVSVVDVAWGLVLAATSVVLAVLSGHWLSWLLAALVTIWGVRLAVHIGRRSRGHGEDPRYEALLGDGGFGAAIRKVFLVQAVAAFVIALPLSAAAVEDVRWPWVVLLGALVWVVGLAFEAIGDAQLTAYKRTPRDQRPPVLDRGLWAWTRHPNYFGDACVWWGIWVAGALSTGWLPGLVTVVGPVAMTHLVRNVSGAKLLERTMSKRPGWEEYAARTPLFVPRPPRR